MPQTFEEFLSAAKANIPVSGFIFNILLSALLAAGLSWIYVKYGSSLSNRRQFGKNFLLITMTTMLIITIVKSSLALSLGLVGALSIVRFRAAIKEPEEIAYLFLAIGVGLGLGADQTVITLIAFSLISAVVIVAKVLSKNSEDHQNLHLIIENPDRRTAPIENIIEILKKNCDGVDLRRLDESEEMLEASFLVEARDFTRLNKAKQELQQLNKALKITLLDNRGLL